MLSSPAHWHSLYKPKLFSNLPPTSKPSMQCTYSQHTVQQIPSAELTHTGLRTEATELVWWFSRDFAPKRLHDHFPLSNGQDYIIVEVNSKTCEGYSQKICWGGAEKKSLKYSNESTTCLWHTRLGPEFNYFSDFIPNFAFWYYRCQKKKLWVYDIPLKQRANICM